VVDGATVEVDEVVGGSVVVVVVVVVEVVDVVEVGGSRVNSVVEEVSSSEPPQEATASPLTTSKVAIRPVMTDIMSESGRRSADLGVGCPVVQRCRRSSGGNR
jgi:hypothetical protein